MNCAVTSCADPSGTVGFFLCRAGQHLRAAAIDSPRHEARLLLAHALECRQEDLLRDPRAVVPAAAAARFAELLRRRLDHTPVAHLLGTRGILVAALRRLPRHPDPPRRFRNR